MRIFIFMGCYILSIIVLTVHFKLRERSLKRLILPAKSNNILREILEVSFDKSNLNESSEKIIDVLKNHYNIDYCTILVDDEGELITAATEVDGIHIEAVQQYANECLSNLEDSHALIRMNKEDYLDYETAERRKIKYSHFIPLQINDEIIGAILIENTSTVDIEKEENNFLNIVFKNIAIVLQNLLYRDKLYALANKDPLTKVYNRRYMDNMLQEYIDGNKHFSVAMMDLDYFKKFNDSYGHDFGDIVLVEVSKYIKSQLSSWGEIFRYGGEEFLIYFNDMSSNEAFEKLDKIREGISKLEITDEEIKGKVTASFGIAEFNNNQGLNELIKNADTDLYSSKKNGRNRVTLYEDIAE